MYLKNNQTNIFLTKDKVLNGIPVLFLHGFTGSSQSWKHIRKDMSCSSFAIDIPGHGKSTFNNINKEYNYKDFRAELYLILQTLNLKKIHLCGYSMGGRIAISFAQKYPELIESLILESSSLGIVNAEDKDNQLSVDCKISEKINNSLESFIDEWSLMDLFKHQKYRSEENYQSQKLIRLSHKKEQLAKSLLSFSKGSMPAFQESFNLFDFPIYLINGHDDTKYIKLNRDMMKINKSCKQFIIDKASHNTHLENSDMFTDILNNSILTKYS